MTAFLLAGVAVAAKHQKGGNRDLVSDTVYDGSYPTDLQNAWAAVQVQFHVTPGDRVNDIAHAYAFCEPTENMALRGADVHADKFTSETTVPGAHLTVRMTGVFEAAGKAKGTGVLESETILGQPCREEAHWTGHALPKGTEMCFTVDPDENVKATVTDMTCGDAAVALQEGLDGEMGNPSARFAPPGWDCTSGGDDVDVKTLCKRGKEIFRLPY